MVFLISSANVYTCLIEACAIPGILFLAVGDSSEQVLVFQVNATVLITTNPT